MKILGSGRAFEKAVESAVEEWMQVESPGKSDRRFTVGREKA